MSSKMMLALAVMVATPAVVSATTFGYYRSVFCDAQSADFLIEGYASPISLSSDKMCHQTPAGTMAMKIDGGIEENCIILAYDDYACTSLVGSVPASGKCVATTNTRIGSWRAMCNVTSPSETTAAETTSYKSGELKRRGKARLLNNARNMPNSTTKDNTRTASSIVSDISSAIAASTRAAVITAPSAGAALSSAIGSGTVVAESYNLTSYVVEPTRLPSMTTTVAPECTNVTGGSGNGTQGNATYTSPKVTNTATYTGVKGGNGTVVLAHGGAAPIRAEGLSMVVGGFALVVGAMLML